MPTFAWVLLVIAIAIAFGVIVFTIYKTLKVICTREPRKYLDPPEKGDE